MPSQYLQTISTLYLVQKKFQFEAISLLVHTFPRVAQAMWLVFVAWSSSQMTFGARHACAVRQFLLSAHLLLPAIIGKPGGSNGRVLVA